LGSFTKVSRLVANEKCLRIDPSPGCEYIRTRPLPSGRTRHTRQKPGARPDPHTVAIADKVVMGPEMRKARAAEGLIPGASKPMSMGRAVRLLV
jgi:hypothetical protein